MEKNLFEIATRNKIRFIFNGVISTEDLWDLNTKQLDSIFMALNKRVKESEGESLLGSKTKETKELDIKIEIIKHIVSVKLDEANARLVVKESKARKEEIMALIAEKDLEEKKGMTKEELLKELEQL